MECSELLRQHHISHLSFKECFLDERRHCRHQKRKWAAEEDEDDSNDVASPETKCRRGEMLYSSSNLVPQIERFVLLPPVASMLTQERCLLQAIFFNSAQKPDFVISHLHGIASDSLKKFRRSRSNTATVHAPLHNVLTTFHGFNPFSSIPQPFQRVSYSPWIGMQMKKNAFLPLPTGGFSRSWLSDSYIQVCNHLLYLQ